MASLAPNSASLFPQRTFHATGLRRALAASSRGSADFFLVPQGHGARTTVSRGAEHEGVHASGQPDSTSFVLRMVQSRKPTGDIANGTAKRDQPGMSFQRKDAADGRPVGGNPNKGDSKIQNGMTGLLPARARPADAPRPGNRSGGFRTDAAISNNRPGGERALQRWVPDASVQDLDGSLEASVSTSHRPWDQFAENERKFGIKTSYDEAYYTTAIDKSHPQYAQRMAAADKKAREIERSAAATSHVAEERVVDFAGGNDQEADEEDK